MVDPLAPPGSEAEGVFKRRLAEEDLVFDPQKRRIDMKAVVLRDHPSPDFPIEFLLVAQGGFAHETLFLCRVTPSLLNACFLAMGLVPGQSVRTVPTIPPPPSDDVLSGKVLPYTIVAPQGTPVYLYVRLPPERGAKAEGGEVKQKILPVEDLLIDRRSGKPPPFKGWIYIGSRFTRHFFRGELKEVYVADFEGNIIATYLRGGGTTLLEWNEAEDQDDLLDVNPGTVPPRETVVDLIFTLDPLPDARQPDLKTDRPVLTVAVAKLRETSKNPVLQKLTDAELKAFANDSFWMIAKRLSQDESARNRAIAAGLLGATRSPGAVKPLLDAFAVEPDAAVRAAIGQALVEIQSYDVVHGLADELQVGTEQRKKEAHALLKQISGADLPPDIAKWQIWLNDNIDRFR
jgi:hypothetical protein